MNLFNFNVHNSMASIHFMHRMMKIFILQIYFTVQLTSNIIVYIGLSDHPIKAINVEHFLFFYDLNEDI